MDLGKTRQSSNVIDHTTLLKLLQPTPTSEVVDFWRRMHQSDEPAISRLNSPWLNPAAEHPVFDGNPNEPNGVEYPEPHHHHPLMDYLNAFLMHLNNR